MIKSSKADTRGTWKCPICKTKDNKPVVLIGIEGSDEVGKLEYEQFHQDCLNLRYSRSEGVVYQYIV